MNLASEISGFRRTTTSDDPWFLLSMDLEMGLLSMDLEMGFNSLLLIFRSVFEGYRRALFPGLYEDLSPEFKATNPGMNPQKSHIESFKRNFISMIF